MQLYPLVALVAAATAVYAAGVQVTTPTTSMIVGVPTQIKWSGGQGPFTLIVHLYENGSPTDVLQTEENVNSPYTFKPPAKASGKALQFDVTDSTGAQGQSGGTPKVSGGSGSGSGSGSSGGSSASSSGGSSSSSSQAGSSAASSASSSGSKPSDGSGSKSGSSSSSKSDAASGPVRVSAGLAATVGLVAAALI